MKSYNYKMKVNESDDTAQIMITYTLPSISKRITEATPDMLKIDSNGIMKIVNMINEQRFEVNCNILTLAKDDPILVNNNEYLVNINVYTAKMPEVTAWYYLDLLGTISPVKDKIILKNFIK